MLFGKQLLFAVFLTAIIFIGCENKQEFLPEVQQSETLLTPRHHALAAMRLKPDTYIFVQDVSSGDSVLVTVEARVETVKEYIRLNVFTFDSIYNKKYSSGFTEGAAERFKLTAVKDSFSFPAVLYSTGNYFVGKSSGEVFAVLLNINTGKIFSAHLFFTGGLVKLYLPPLSQQPHISSFFTRYFAVDYPDVQLSPTDFTMPL